MFNLAKLKGRIIEKYGSQGAFAEHIKRTQAYVSGVLNGRSFLDAKDVYEWAEALEIEKEDIGLYFFTT